MNQQAQEHRQSGGVGAFKHALKTTVLLLKFAMILLLGAFLFSNVIDLEQYEKAIVMRFGEQRGTLIEEPGKHFAWPYPIDRVIKVETGRTKTLTSETFIAAKSRSETINTFLKPGVDGYLITGDANIVHCKSTMSFLVVDLEKYIFSVDDRARMKTREKLLLSLLDSAVLKAVGSQSLTEVLANKNLIGDSKLILQKSIDDLNLGIKVELLKLSTYIPRQVEDSYLDVKNAQQDESRLLSEADTYERKSRDTAESKSRRILGDADVWGTRIFRRSEADLATFKKLLPSYQKDPEQVKNMLLRDAMVEVIPHLEEVFIFDNNKKRELRIVMPRKNPNSGAVNEAK